MALQFEWDRDKATTNERKHGVSFVEAVSVFADPLAVIFFDEWHSGDEDREIIEGRSSRDRLLLVSFTERGEAIRIISAREANKKERKDYETKPR